MKLGKDFYYFRIGQFISILGDYSNTIALAWFILEMSGSSAQMSIVLTGATIARIGMLPFFGPIADRFSRKSIIIISDLIRLSATLGIVTLLYMNYYSVFLLTSLYIISGIGTALFYSAESAITPHLVKDEYLHEATSKTFTINSIAQVLGGALGGIFVSSVGVKGAFIIDAGSFFLALCFTALIKSNTNPLANEGHKSDLNHPLKRWFFDLQNGLKALYKIKVLFWLSIIAMITNFALAPIALVLPYLANITFKMSASYLGLTESLLSIGAVIGGILTPYILKRIKGDHAVVLGLLIRGLSFILMALFLDPYIILIFIFFSGMAQTIIGVPVRSQMALAVPHSYRSRIFSIFAFLAQSVNPLGLVIAGFILEDSKVRFLLTGMGILILLNIGFIFIVPHLAVFLRSKEGDTKKFINEHYTTVSLK